MHRSGTSVTTRIINLLGAELGDNLIPASIGNEHGHWESRAVQGLHNRMLAQLGSDIYSPVNFPSEWFGSAAAQAWIGCMQDLVAEEYATSAFFVLKDPRIALFLPLWREAMHQSSIDARFVLPFRRPDAVAASLERREGRLQSGNVLPHAQGVAVWLRYVLAAEKFTRGQPRSFVAYDRLLADWRAEFTRIGRQLGVEWPSWPHAQRVIDDFIDAGARRSETDQPLREPGGIHDSVHSSLERAVVQPESDPSAFDAASQAMAAAEDLLGSHILAREQVFAGLLHRVDAASRQYEIERAEMHGRFADEIGLRDARVAEATTHAEAMKQTVEMLERERSKAFDYARSLEQDRDRALEYARSLGPDRDEAAGKAERADLHSRFAVEIGLRDARIAEATAYARRMEDAVAALERERSKASDYARSLERDRDRALEYASTLQHSRDEAVEYAHSLEQAPGAETRREGVPTPAGNVTPVFFTIASRNYLAYAMTLMQSVAAQYPDAPRYLILADRAAADPALVDAPFATILAEALAIPDFEAFAFRYTIMEFNTAIKPYSFAHLRRLHPDAGIVYLDPDILVTAPLVQVETAFAEGRLAVLTPHLLEPIPDDRHPGERDMLMSGAYNCGFIAIGPHAQADRLIAWWAQRLEFGAFSDVAAGLFTDQKWVDLVPGLFPDIHILRDEGYNLAYWNLSQRPVSQRGPDWYAAEKRLAFVHFSGVDIDRPAQFSKHQNRHTQATIGELRPLYASYLARLAANGHVEHRAKPYAFGRFADGEAICEPVRAVYRRYFDKGASQPQRDPYSMDRTLYDLPCEELPERADLPMTRLMYATWKMREDLRRVFDVGEAEGREGFIRWFISTAGPEMRVPERHIAPARRALAERETAQAPTRKPRKWRPAPEPVRRTGSVLLRLINWSCRFPLALRLYARIPESTRHRLRRRLERIAFTRKARTTVPAAGTEHPPGINLVGYAHGEFGVAEILRRYAHTLQEGGVPFLVRNFDVGVASRLSDRSMQQFLAAQCRYDVNLFCINADQMPVARQYLGDAVFGGRYNIACWFWELEKFPEQWHGAIDLVDEIWVTSPFVRDAIAACTPKPVHIVPVALEVNLPRAHSRSEVGLAEGVFVCLFSFDFNSYVTRKNAEGVIAAFRRAFAEERSDVRLVIKTINGERFPEALRKLTEAAGGDERIEVRDGFLDRIGMWALQACCDCYVSLHRSEGLGLGMAECMLLGKPVVATAYSGNLAFMDADNSCLVGYSLVAVEEGEYPAWQDQHWAEPDLDEAAAYLRRLADDPAYAQQIGEKARASVRERLSAEASLAAMTARLARIRSK